MNFFVLKPLKENRYVIPKSRYDSIDSYLSPCGEKYNDIPLVMDKEIFDQLTEAGIYFNVLFIYRIRLFFGGLD